jgi:hypothetical protein
LTSQILRVTLIIEGLISESTEEKGEAMETAMTWVRSDEGGEIREYRTPVGKSVVVVQCRTTSLSDVSAEWFAIIDEKATPAVHLGAHTDNAVLRHVEGRILRHHAKSEVAAIRDAQKNREGWIPKKGRLPSRDFGFLATKYVHYPRKMPKDPFADDDPPIELSRDMRDGF